MSPAPATLSQVVQIGVEAVAGTPVPPTFRFKGISLSFTPESEFQMTRPRGDKFASAHQQTQDSSTGDISGGLAFDEAHILLSGIFSKPAAPGAVESGEAFRASSQYRAKEVVRPTDTATVVYPNLFRVTTPGVSGATAPDWGTAAAAGATVTSGTVVFTNTGVAKTDPTGAFKYLFDIDNFSTDEINTFTVEQGDKRQGRGRRISYAIINELSVSSARSGEVEVSGSMIGRNMGKAALTVAALHEVRPILATPPMLNVYLDDTPEAIGTTKIKNFSIEMGLSDRFGPVWLHDRDLDSWDEHVETEPSLTTSLTILDSDKVDDFMEGAREGVRRYLRMEFLGPEIAPGARYSFVWDSALQISDAYSLDDEDGAYAAEMSFEAEYDETLGYATHAELVNSQGNIGTAAVSTADDGGASTAVATTEEQAATSDEPATTQGGVVAAQELASDARRAAQEAERAAEKLDQEGDGE